MSKIDDLTRLIKSAKSEKVVEYYLQILKKEYEKEIGQHDKTN